ncbi:MAG: mono/diheme cytochrome c family protein [Cyclobacteriaceae bacterium]|jgi:mono/diheme cytochrome c family protein
MALLKYVTLSKSLAGRRRSGVQQAPRLNTGARYWPVATRYGSVIQALPGMKIVLIACLKIVLPAALVIGLLTGPLSSQRALADDIVEATAVTTTPAFSQSQANAGKKVYKQSCLSCHPKGYFDQVFRAWQGEPLGALYGIMQTDMPQGNPGGLSAEEYAQVFAYILKEAGYPSGTVALAPDDVTFREWQIHAVE